MPENNPSSSPTEGKRCPTCKAVIPPDAPEGLCPACLAGGAFNLPRTTHGGLVGAFTPPSAAELDASIPAYEILELIGSGGMGAVYKARQTQLNRLVALKLLATDPSAADPEFAERFKREAQAMARLGHPHIVTVHDFGKTTDDRFYLVMEFVEGANLHDLIHSGHVTPAEALAIVPQICEALQYAHGRGIIHRDIKPANILIDTEGTVKLTDFGLAKILGTHDTSIYTLTQDGSAMGTPSYMAPEQTTGSATVDHRADIYSLGVVFYELLTGQIPKGVFDPPSKKVEVDVRLDEVVLRAMQSEPERRYQEVSEMKSRVEEVSSPRVEPAAESGRSHGEPASREGRRNPLFPTVAVFAIAAALFGIWKWAPWSGSAGTELPGGEPTIKGPHQAGDRLVIPIADGLEMAFRWCPPGSFLMGSPESEPGRITAQEKYQVNFEDQQKVELTRGFWIGETEVTQAQWIAFMEENPSNFKGQQWPVDSVSWHDAMEFSRKLTRHLRESGSLPDGIEVSLPTEAEWEYACRAGTTSALNNGKALTSDEFCKNLAEIAWHAGNSARATHGVGQLTANRWGLHDMHGNVQEWCGDGFDPAPQGGKDPQGLASSPKRALRGGCYSAWAFTCRSAFRRGHSPSNKVVLAGENPGFRVALVQVKAEPVEAEQVKKPERAVALNRNDNDGSTMPSAGWNRGLRSADAAYDDSNFDEALTLYQEAETLVEADTEEDSDSHQEARARITQRLDLCRFIIERAKLPAEEQVEATQAKLKELNPDYKGTGKFEVEDGSVVKADLHSRGIVNAGPLKGLPLTSVLLGGNQIGDLEPLRGMILQELNVTGDQLSDLGPLKGMPLKKLGIRDTQVANLSPLKGAPLQELHLVQIVKLSDLSPLEGMELRRLFINETSVTDLEPLRGMPLVVLNANGTEKLTNLEPLAGMKLRALELDQTSVEDLGVLAGMPLYNLRIGRTNVTDLSPLEGMKLQVLDMQWLRVESITPLAGMKTLRSCPGGERVLLTTVGKLMFEDDFIRARKEAARLADEFKAVPAFQPLLQQLVQLGEACEALSKNPNTQHERIKTFHGHRYLLVPASLPWDEARVFCERLGGHLLTTETPEEHRFVYETFTTFTNTHGTQTRPVTAI